MHIPSATSGMRHFVSELIALDVEIIIVEVSNLWDLYYGAPIYDECFDEEAIAVSYSLDIESFQRQINTCMDIMTTLSSQII